MPKLNLTRRQFLKASGASLFLAGFPLPGFPLPPECHARLGRNVRWSPTKMFHIFQTHND